MRRSPAGPARLLLRQNQGARDSAAVASGERSLALRGSADGAAAGVSGAETGVAHVAQLADVNALAAEHSQDSGSLTPSRLRATGGTVAHGRRGHHSLPERICRAILDPVTVDTMLVCFRQSVESVASLRRRPTSWEVRL